MSGSLSSTTSGATSGFQMNSSAESQINADATNFDSLIGQGASTQQQTVAGQKLDSDLNADLVQSFGANQAGLSDASGDAVAAYADQLEGMMGDIGSSGSAAALQQFAKTIESETSQGSTSTSALASPDSDVASSAVASGSGRSGMMQMMQEMLQMLEQAMTMMQGSQTGGSTGDASGSPSSGATSPGLTQPGLTDGPGLSGALPTPLENGLKPFISIPVHDGGVQQGSTSGPQVTGNVEQDTQTLMSLIGGVGTDGNTLGSFASALGKEASSQGNSAVANWANNLAGSLGNGTYDQQGSLSAGMAAMQGKGVNSVQNNMSAILTQLESGQSTGSIANNLNALSTELKDSGRPQMAEQLSKLASGLQDGSISKPQGTQLMQILQELSKLSTSGGLTALPETTTPTATAPLTSSLPDTAEGLGPEVSNTGTKQLDQMMQMLEQMMQMMEMTQMMQGGLSQAA